MWGVRQSRTPAEEAAETEEAAASGRICLVWFGTLLGGNIDVEIGLDFVET